MFFSGSGGELERITHQLQGLMDGMECWDREDIFRKLLPPASVIIARDPTGGMKGREPELRPRLPSSLVFFQTNFIFNQNIPSHFSLFSRMKNSHFVKVNPRSAKI